MGDAKAAFRLRNLPAGAYHIDPRAPASGWFLRSVTTGQTTSRNPVISFTDSITVRTGETVSGLMITFTEGAATIRGSVKASKDQQLPNRAVVYLVPAEKGSTANPFRYFEAQVAGDGKFAIGNVAPGEYFVVALAASNQAGSTAIAIRDDAALRTVVAREAEKLKQNLILKPCERLDNYELTFTPATNP